MESIDDRRRGAFDLAGLDGAQTAPDLSQDSAGSIRIIVRAPLLGLTSEPSCDNRSLL
jgi:hypothetical protein